MTSRLQTWTAIRRGSIESLLLGISDRTLVVVSHQFSGERIGAFDGVIDRKAPRKPVH